MARVLTCRSPLSATVLADLAALIGSGGLFAAPTESSYALCVSPFDARAVDRLCAAKGRPETKPILVLIGQRDQLKSLAAFVPPAADCLMSRHWPGPLTLVLPALPTLPTALTAGTGTIGIRLPAHPSLVELLTALGPVTGTSANRAGAVPLTTAEEVAREFAKEVDAVVDLGPAGGDVPSTLVDAREGDVRMLREGPISAGQIRLTLTEAGYRLIA